MQHTIVEYDTQLSSIIVRETVDGVDDMPEVTRGYIILVRVDERMNSLNQPMKASERSVFVFFSFWDRLAMSIAGVLPHLLSI